MAITGTLEICHETTSLSRDERGKSEAEELTWPSLLLAATAPECGQKKDLTGFADRFKDTAGAHLAVNRHRD
jgi:hypothetical protein